MQQELRQRGGTIIAVTGIILLFIIGVIHLHAEGKTIHRKVQDGSYQESDGVLIRDNPEIRDLHRQIVDHGNKILKTKEEIENINRDLERIHHEKKTLQGELSALSLTKRQNEAQIQVTEEAVGQSQLKIQSLSRSIEDSIKNVAVLQSVLQKNYRLENEFGLKSTGMQIFLHPTFFEVLRWVEETGQYTEALHEQLALLEQQITGLERNRKDVLTERSTLEDYKHELEDRKKIHLFSIAQKEVLVNRTKNDEAVYQRLLAEKQHEFLGLQKEILQYESRIKYLRDPSRLPDAQPGLLRQPFNGSAPITQLFGRTKFAVANAARYGRPLHNGIDFGTPIGTEIVAAAEGTIIGVGNTDVVASCQSWGKWVLIEHPFGLTTLYAHLSLTKVRLGQSVASGDLIGYSGNTGFSTGPHLHFGVYDSSGVKVVPYSKVSSGSRCRGLDIPVAAKDANIDPALYLEL